LNYEVKKVTLCVVEIVSLQNATVRGFTKYKKSLLLEETIKKILEKTGYHL